MNVTLHRLLQRQIKKNISPDLLQNPEIKNFIDSVNNAYLNYDKDFKQLERILEISSNESFKELKKLSLVADETKSAVIITNANGEIEWVNKAFENLTQYKLQEVINKKPGHLLQGELSDKETLKTISENLKNKISFEIEVLNYRKDKTSYWSKLQVQPIFDENGKLIQFFSIQQDSTDEKNAKEILKRNEEKYRNIIESINLGLIETDPNDIILYANQSFCDMSGFALDDMIGKEAKNLFVPVEEQNKIIEKEKLRQNNKSDAYELNVKTKNGENKTWLISGAPIHNNKGEYIGSIGIHLDITQQKENQRDLLLFQKLLDNSGDSLQISDETGKFFYVNAAGVKRLKYTLHELKQMYVHEIEEYFKIPNNWENHVKDLKSKKEGVLIEGININHLGKKFPVEVKANYTVVDNKGYVIAFSRDISDRKDLENKKEELVLSLKKANQELVDFAYIVSHDLKAPLRAIGSLCGWLNADYSDKLDDEGKNILNLLEQRTQRMANLIEGVLNYSKVGQTQEAVELQNTLQVVENIVDLLSPPKNIEVIIDKNLPNVFYENIKFGQVFQNLLSNAIKFMDKENGKIEIGFVKKNNEVDFFVKDNGPGIEEIHQQKIFQIFQTLNSRDNFESTGVGLSIVKKIVETNGGKIWVTSKVGEGTTFYFSTLINK